MPPKKSFTSLSHKWFPHTQHQLQHHRVISFTECIGVSLACTSVSFRRGAADGVYSISISFSCFGQAQWRMSERGFLEEFKRCAHWKMCECARCGGARWICGAARARWGLARAAPHTRSHGHTKDNHINIPFAEILAYNHNFAIFTSHSLSHKYKFYSRFI